MNNCFIPCTNKSSVPYQNKYPSTFSFTTRGSNQSIKIVGLTVRDKGGNEECEVVGESTIIIANSKGIKDSFQSLGCQIFTKAHMEGVVKKISIFIKYGELKRGGAIIVMEETVEKVNRISVAIKDYGMTSVAESVCVFRKNYSAVMSKEKSVFAVRLKK